MKRLRFADGVDPNSDRVSSQGALTRSLTMLNSDLKVVSLLGNACAATMIGRWEEHARQCCGC